MAEALSEITFVGMARRPTTQPAPSALNMPGWKKIAGAIRDAVESSGIPVQLIADRTGLSRQYIYSMMNGTCNPSMDKIENVMAAAGTSLVEWIDDKSAYGRDKRLHDQIQTILNNKGMNAIALRRTIEGLLALASEKTE